MNKNRFLPYVYYVCGVSLLLYANSAFAVQFVPGKNPNVADMLINFSQTVPNFMRLVSAFAYLMGTWCVVKAIIEFRHFGEGRSMMSREHSIATPITYLLVGGALIYLPSTIRAGVSTFWVDANPMAYVTTDTTSTWNQLTNGVFMIVQLVGVISLIRGLLQLTHTSGHHGQQGTFAKALAHIIAGILCINLYGFLNSVMATLQLGQLK